MPRSNNDNNNHHDLPLQEPLRGIIREKITRAALNNYHNHMLSPLLEVLLSKPVRILAFWSLNVRDNCE